MNQTREFIRKYHEEQLKDETLPQKLEGRFELLACIHVTETHASFLLRREETGEKYLLKCGQMGRTSSLSVECKQQTRIGEVMEQSETEIVYWTEDEKEYLLRRYIEGQNLEEYLERNPILEEREVLDIAIQICDILTKLHQLNPPLIHRDIKPQNLILDRYGTVHLIDFETSRNFDRNKRKDTKFYGTEVTAAPEQYGYAQTDERTDIYAFGKVLCYLLTGDYQVEVCSETGGKLYRIVAKCCAFDPGKRYQTIAEVEKLLITERKKLEPDGRKKFRYFIGTAAAIICIFMAGMYAGGYVIGHQTRTYVQDGDTNHMEQEENDGTAGGVANPEDAETGEELLNRAVAFSLHKENVTEDDYKNVYRIAVIGTDVYDITERFDVNEICYKDEDYVCNRDSGKIADISLLGKMENLAEVYLYNQDITNIDVLEGLPIRKLYLSNNKIEDFRVIEKLPKLEELGITRNPIRYMPDFAKCTRLRSLIMNENTFSDLDCLRDSAIEQMSVRSFNVLNGDYTFLEAMPKLERLRVWDPDAEWVEEISRLSNLRELYLFNYSRENLDFLRSLQNIELLHIHSSYIIDVSSLADLPRLNILGFDYSVEDISVVPGISNLQSLDISETDVTDLSPIPDCKRLTELIVNEEQAAYIEEHDPQHGYRVIVR